MDGEALHTNCLMMLAQKKKQKRKRNTGLTNTIPPILSMDIICCQVAMFQIIVQHLKCVTNLEMEIEAESIQKARKKR